jgi:hypothetical protein
MFNLVFKLYKLYLFDTSIFFSIQFWYKNYYYYFSPWFERRKRERERERSSDFDGKERKISLAPIHVTKKSIFMSNDSI